MVTPAARRTWLRIPSRSRRSALPRSDARRLGHDIASKRPLERRLQERENVVQACLWFGSRGLRASFVHRHYAAA